MQSAVDEGQRDCALSDLSERHRLITALTFTREAVLAVGLSATTSTVVDLYLEAMRELTSLLEGAALRS